jgi:Tol biopolymer transport system component
VASSLKASPNGKKLAVLGRRSSGSSTNLYLLNPESTRFEALTSNEGMNIKTGGKNIAWSPDGKSVVIVAQSSSSKTGTYNKYSDELLKPFYNLYEVPTQ